VQALDTLLGTAEHRDLKGHIRLVRYDRHAQSITAKFSSACDVRVIWGGDDTVKNIRRHPLPARAFDVTFADRYSICVIGAQRYLDEGKACEYAAGFYNDAYLFDQNACTAPHLVLWLGSEEVVQQARDVFWSELHFHAQGRYVLEPRFGIDKLAQSLYYAALHPGCLIMPSQDNIIKRISLERLQAGIDDWHGNGGFFFEYSLTDLREILPIISRRYQTLSYAGLDAAMLRDLVIHGRASGIDRIVPIGRTLNFSLQWDGYDLIRTLSRLVAVV
jgi:hypothetical protein